MAVQLLGISNAIVDVLAHVEEDFLESIGAAKGSMTLIFAIPNWRCYAWQKSMMRKAVQPT